MKIRLLNVRRETRKFPPIFGRKKFIFHHFFLSIFFFFSSAKYPATWTNDNNTRIVRENEHKITTEGYFRTKYFVEKEEGGTYSILTYIRGRDIRLDVVEKFRAIYIYSYLCLPFISWQSFVSRCPISFLLFPRCEMDTRYLLFQGFWFIALLFITFLRLIIIPKIVGAYIAKYCSSCVFISPSIHRGEQVFSHSHRRFSRYFRFVEKMFYKIDLKRSS